jgi:hypothetical protein
VNDFSVAMIELWPLISISLERIGIKTCVVCLMLLSLLLLVGGSMVGLDILFAYLFRISNYLIVYKYKALYIFLHVYFTSQVLQISVLTKKYRTYI